MPKRPRKIGRQAELPLSAPDMRDEVAHTVIGATVMACVQRLMKERDVSRDDLADWLSARRGRRVSLAVINDWFTPSKVWHWPDFPELGLICECLESLEPLDVFIRHFGGAAIGRREQKLLEVGRNYLEERRLEVRRSHLDMAVQNILIDEIRHGRG